MGLSAANGSLDSQKELEASSFVRFVKDFIAIHSGSHDSKWVNGFTTEALCREFGLEDASVAQSALDTLVQQGFITDMNGMSGCYIRPSAYSHLLMKKEAVQVDVQQAQGVVNFEKCLVRIASLITFHSHPFYGQWVQGFTCLDICTELRWEDGAYIQLILDSLLQQGAIIEIAARKGVYVSIGNKPSH